MVVTLDQLRPYDHDPRVTRNPAYEDIKASIRERGLDAPPAITRRPGEPHYIIRNGGNTRLAILRELWSETKGRTLLPHPLPVPPLAAARRVVMLTGHLAENELRGGLSFIERALGVEKAREFYEQEMGRTAASHCRRASWRGGSRPMASAAAVSHQPHAGRGALPAAGDPEPVVRWARPPSGRTARGAAQGL